MKNDNKFIDFFQSSETMKTVIFQTFSHLQLLVVFRLSLSDSKSPRIFRTLYSILADLNNTVVWMVSFLPLVTTY